MSTNSIGELDPTVAEFLGEKIPTRLLAKAERFTARFCPKGQVAIAILLVYAEEIGKTEEALQALQRPWRRDWRHQHPELRGDPSLSTTNRLALESVYRNLGLRLPWQR